MVSLRRQILIVWRLQVSGSPTPIAGMLTLGSSRPTWLHGLGAVGYRPVLVGRMHFLGQDQLRGYVHRPIRDHSPAWPGVPRRGLGVLAKTSGPFRESIEKSGPGQRSYQLMDEDVLAASVDFLKLHGASGTNEPFCLCASFMLPHPPYVARQADFDAVKDKAPTPNIPTPPEDEHEWIKIWRDAKALKEVSQSDVRRARCAYYALVMQLDRAVGSLIQTLEDTGLSKNTLVIYVSDLGYHIGHRGFFGKHMFYDEAVKVPSILNWPDEIASGQVCDLHRGFVAQIG